ncbi:MAG: DUF4372 domain-containing protein [Prevotellaceae bacterium]|nr:DUF4372 domain-containing protein [Prevotellaceae bacterium]
MLFGQLSNRESLRDLITVVQAHRSKAYHLGLGKAVNISTLACARRLRANAAFEVNTNGEIYAFDSSTISLCLSVVWWATYKRQYISKYIFSGRPVDYTGLYQLLINKKNEIEAYELSLINQGGELTPERLNGFVDNILLSKDKIRDTSDGLNIDTVFPKVSEQEIINTSNADKYPVWIISRPIKGKK